MTADIRTAARKEAERSFNDGSDEMSECCPDVQYGFERGAAWGVARVTPTREQIAELEVPLGDGRVLRLGTPVADTVLALMAGLAERES